MKEKLKKDELQSIQVSTGEFEIIEDTKMQQPLEENLQTTEANLQQDMQAGQQLIQNVDQAPAFAQKVIQPEISLDEQFKTAHQRAHENEQHPAKMKKSTLKKRRKEYKRKTTEQSAMLAVKAQLEDMKSGPLRTGLMAEFSNKLGDEEHSATGDPEYMGKMMDAVMYMAKSEQLSVTELTIISHDLSLNVKNLTKADSLQKDVRERYNGKMLIYEKLFKDVLSWNIDEFALKDNHVMAKDANLGKKMEKLSLLPMLRTAFKEYKAACDDSGFESQMEQFRDKKDRDRRFPEDLFGELESRLTYFEDVKAEYDCRIDLMSNKYYALLGQSDTANLKLPQLEELSTKKDMDPELRAYYDAIKRHRSRKDTGRSLKGKKPKNTLAKIRKEKNVKAPDARFNTAKEDWIRSFNVNYKNTNRSRQEKFIEHGGLNISNFKFDNEAVIDHEIASVYHSLGIELTEEIKAEVKANFKERLEGSKNAWTNSDDYEKSIKALDTKLENNYKITHPGKFEGVREERDCVVSYVMFKDFKIQDEEGNALEGDAFENEKFRKQAELYSAVMNPFHPDFRQSKNPATKKEVEQRSAKALFDMIVDAAEQDKKQGEILSKYGSPEEFCRKCTKEEYNFLKMMLRIGSLVNNNIFDRPQENQYLMEMIDQNHLEDFYVKLKTTAYNFVGLDNYMKLVANNNYAFIDSKTLDMLTKADNQSMAKAQTDHPSTNQTINGNKRISLRLQARAARGSSDQVRIGKSYDTRRQKDKDQFATDMKEKKWQRQIDMMKK